MGRANTAPYGVLRKLPLLYIPVRQEIGTWSALVKTYRLMRGVHVVHCQFWGQYLKADESKNA